MVMLSYVEFISLLDYAYQPYRAPVLRQHRMKTSKIGGSLVPPPRRSDKFLGYGDNIMPFNRLPKSLKEQVISNRIVNGDERSFLKDSANANLVSKEEEDDSIDYEDVEDDTDDVVGEEGDEDIEDDDDDDDDGLDKEGLLTPPLVQIRNRMMPEQFPQQQNQNRMMPGSLPARFRRRKMYNMPQRMPAAIPNSKLQFNQIRQRKNVNGGETPFIDWLDKFKKELFSKLDSHKRKVNTSFKNMLVQLCL